MGVFTVCYWYFFLDRVLKTRKRPFYKMANRGVVGWAVLCGVNAVLGAQLRKLDPVELFVVGIIILRFVAG